MSARSPTLDSETYFDSPLILPVRPVYVYVRGGACCDLARLLMEGYSFELGLFFDICGLEDVIGSIEDDKCIARYVCLRGGEVSLPPDDLKKTLIVIQ